ncbi:MULTISPECIES: nuclear transport factor 2 family protein [unclassified Nocardioides]|uniref:nuclear transport factor 2 family protein n=1 Tax=unclassified Nocardioides TaxID=2615069 RepID=UPI001885C9FB|nr:MULTISPECIES: nuclear transport factor 2 family protein [unclassified Nocardioides]
MSELTRAEIEEFWESWLEVNREAERTGDWRVLAESFALDATYGWMYSVDEHFMAVGREQIRDWAIGIEMDGFDGWRYDYQCAVIDERKGMIVGFWKQRSGIVDDRTGQEFEIRGLGGSWFGVERQVGGPDDGLVKIAWQRDWFDMPSTAHTFIEILKSGKAPETLTERMKVTGLEVPGHYRHADLPSTVWPPPVEEGRYLAQPPAPSPAGSAAAEPSA